MSNSFHIGIDGGGTKTTCSIIDDLNNVISSETSGSTNQNSVGGEKVFENLKEAIEKCMKSDPAVTPEKISSIGLSMAGVDRPDDKTFVKGIIDRIIADLGMKNPKVIVENDAVGSLCATTMGKMEGIVLISGTGMICFGFANGKNGPLRCRSGGWGPLFLDRGSGFWIGQSVIRKIAEIHDGRSTEKSELPKKILDELGLKCPTELIPYVYEKTDWSRIASLAKPCLEICEKDDVARNIVESSADALVQYVKVVCRKMEKELDGRKITLVLSGSILTHDNSPMAKLLKKKLEGEKVIGKIDFPKVNPSVGAALMYKAE